MISERQPASNNPDAWRKDIPDLPNPINVVRRQIHFRGKTKITTCFPAMSSELEHAVGDARSNKPRLPDIDASSWQIFSRPGHRVWETGFAFTGLLSSTCSCVVDHHGIRLRTQADQPLVVDSSSPRCHRQVSKPRYRARSLHIHRTRRVSNVALQALLQ